jgi:hypothetical protein
MCFYLEKTSRISVVGIVTRLAYCEKAGLQGELLYLLFLTKLGKVILRNVNLIKLLS